MASSRPGTCSPPNAPVISWAAAALALSIAWLTADTTRSSRSSVSEPARDCGVNTAGHKSLLAISFDRYHATTGSSFDADFGQLFLNFIDPSL